MKTIPKKKRRMNNTSEATEDPNNSVIKTISKIYANVLSEKPESFFKYETYQPQLIDQIDNYSLIRPIGQGKYSVVFEGFHEPTEKNVIVKILKAIRKYKVNREIKILEHLKYADNIVKLNCTVRVPKPNSAALIFEQLPNCTDFRSIICDLNAHEIRFYTYELLRALDYCHSQGIMHRDVKPTNIIVDRSNKRLVLIDFGLAEFYIPGRNYNVRVASRHFKSPELLVDYNYYDYSLDLWSVGCMFASMLFRRCPFFAGKDNQSQLNCIVRVLGSERFGNFLTKYSIQLPITHPLPTKKYKQKSWDCFITTENQHLIDGNALQLLDGFLKFDHSARITAKQAMQHEYFRVLDRTEHFLEEN